MSDARLRTHGATAKRRSCWCALAALLPLLAFAAPAQAGTASIVFPATSAQGDDESIDLVTPIGPGQPHPAVRIHAPSQPTGCTSVDTDPGATIQEWAIDEGTTVEELGTADWGPREVGTYEFCVYFADGSYVEIDREVVPAFTFTLTATPGNAGSPTGVALTGTLALAPTQQYGIELKYRVAGGLPCSPVPATEPGTVIVPAGSNYNYWFVDAGAIAIRGDTAPLAAGTYLLCMWQASDGWVPDLADITLAASTTFVVGSPPATAAAAAGAAPPATSPSRALPRNLAPPSLTGRFRAGSTVRCSIGSWTSPPTISAYRWYRGMRRIAGASAATYRITKLDAGRRLHCQVVIASGDTHAASRSSASHAVAR